MTHLSIAVSSLAKPIVKVRSASVYMLFDFYMLLCFDFGGTRSSLVLNLHRKMPQSASTCAKRNL
jgi:hypothetical protein